MKSVELKPDIYWVGAIDWPIRDFHGYVIPRGTTYNNYLIVDDEVTLLDTVKHDFAGESINNVTAVIDPSKIRNIVINHVENDHVSSLDRFMALAPDARIYITERGRQVIDRFFDISSWNVNVVKTGDELKTGKHTLQFIETPMLHWPDSMMTYVPEKKLLFSQDAFGQHMATSVRFDDEFTARVSRKHLDDAIVDYYANILMPLGPLIKSKIEAIRDMGIEIDMIAPVHGLVWRSDPGRVMDMYMDMATGRADLAVSIIYDTMWNSTEIMTEPLARGIWDEGVDCRVIRLGNSPVSEAITELWKSRGFLVGTPTLNNGVFPSVAQFMSLLKGLRPKDRMAGAFGSYGWAGGAVKWLYEQFGEMKLEAVEGGVEVKYKPSPEEMQECYEFGRRFAQQVREYHGKYE